jgi:hypothetical protein
MSGAAATLARASAPQGLSSQTSLVKIDSHHQISEEDRKRPREPKFLSTKWMDYRMLLAITAVCNMGVR